MTKDRVAVFAVLSGVENVLMPEFVDFLAGRRKHVLRFLVRQGIEAAFVAAFHFLRMLTAPALRLHEFGPKRA
jgi:hypothetical protein